MIIADIVKVFIPALVSFVIGVGITPILANFLYKREMWKKKAGKVDMNGAETPIFNSLHKEKEVGTPRMGGIVIWASSAITILAIWLLSYVFPGDFVSKLDFLSRGQTWLPFFTLIFGALVGLVDDYFEIKGNGTHVAGGLSLRKRLLIVGFIGLLSALWFYFKLDVHSIGLPYGMEIEIGAWFIALFVLVVLGIYSGGIIDGLDGLAGGIFASMFAAYAGIAFYQNQINLSAFCATILGGILAFLWFNIPPARFYMSETGSMALTITLAIVAFMTDRLGDGYGVLVLPVIAMPLVMTTFSVILQVLSKKFRGGKKVFLVAPLHHHFEALGWPAYKVTMRFWIIGVVFALFGLILGIIG